MPRQETGGLEEIGYAHWDDEADEEELIEGSVSTDGVSFRIEDVGKEELQAFGLLVLLAGLIVLGRAYRRRR